MSMLLYLISRAIIIIFFVGLIPHRQRGCSRITWGSESPCNFPPVSCLLSPVSFFKALHNCGMILSESRNHNPRVPMSPCLRVGLNHPSIQQRLNMVLGFVSLNPTYKFYFTITMQDYLIFFFFPFKEKALYVNLLIM